MVDYRKLPDNELAERLSKDDGRAFTELYERFSAPLYRYALSMMKDDDEAHDLVHDLFLKIWENRVSIQIKQTVKAYFYRSIHNLVLMRLNRSKFMENYLDALQHELTHQSLPADSPLMQKELELRIEANLSSLPQRTREVFELSRFQEKSYKEIGEDLHISTETVQSHIKKALKIFRKGLNSLLFLFL